MSASNADKDNEDYLHTSLWGGRTVQPLWKIDRGFL